MASQKSVKNTPGFAERASTQAGRENVWQRFSSGADFQLEMIETLEALADQTFPGDKFNAASYMEAIVNSLTETISPEVGVKDFWQKMAEAGCKEVRIENGHMNFYAGKGAKAKKIDITSFTQPIVFEAHSSFYKQRQLERHEKILAAKKQLAELRAEIGKREKK